MRSGFLGTKKLEEDEEEETSFFEQIDLNVKKVVKEKGIAKSLDYYHKIHPSYGIARTEPLRQMCGSPNIQQFPKDKTARTIFKLPEDYIFGEFDISGFHLRLMAFLSGDPTMRDIFLNKSGDMHSMTGNSVFCREMPFEEFLSKKGEPPYNGYRQEAKGINFLFLYNGTPYVLKPVIELNWTLDNMLSYINESKCELELDKNGNPDFAFTVAKDIHAKFMQTYPGIPAYSNKQIEFACEHGYIDSPLGSRRHLPELTIKIAKPSKDIAKHINHLHSVATNTEILSMEALMMHRAMKGIHDELKEKNLRSQIILMIHDSVALKVYKPEIEEVTKICIHHLQNFECDGIPIIAESLFSNVWGFSDK
jgi:DNA polymerase-1